MVFNIKYLFCLTILLSVFKPRARTEMITATERKNPLVEINRIIDVDEYITNEEERLEALNSHLLTAEECYMLCKAFYSRKDLTNTLTWSIETLRKYKEETTEEHSFTEVDVLEYIAYVHYLMADVKNALKWTKKLLKLDPNHPRAAGNLPQYEDIIAGQERASKELEDTGEQTEDEKANAIKRSQEMHELNLGKIHFMTADDCYELSKVFYNNRQYKYSLAWNMETLRKYKEETTEEHSFTEVDVLEYIAFTHYLMGDAKTALKWTKKLLKLNPKHQRAAGNVPWYKDIIARQERASKELEDTGEQTEDEKANAIKRSQEMHELNIAKIHFMMAEDCFELSIDFYNNKEYNYSLAWSMETLRKYKEETTEEHSFTEVDVLEYIAYTHYLMGDAKTALKWTKKLLKLNPKHQRAAGNVPWYKDIIARQERASKELEDTGEQTEDEKANAIKRSQEMHELNIAKIHFMMAEDCFELSIDFYNNKEYNYSLAWSMETLRKYKEETTEEHSFTEVDVLEYIAYTHYLMGDVKTALKWTKKLRAAGNVAWYKDIIARQERASKELEDTGEQTEDEKANAIKQSQEMHELNIAKTHFMTAEDCFELSMDFYNKKYYNHSLTWSMETLRKYKEETTEEHSFTEVDVLEYIAFTHYLMGDVRTALEWTKKLLKLDPYHPRAAANVPRYEDIIARGDGKLNFNKLPVGHQFDFAKSLQMTAADCFELGKALYHNSEYNNSLAWNMESLRKYKNETTEQHSFTEVDVLDYIAFTHYLMGDAKTALKWTKKLLKLDPKHQRAVGNVAWYEDIIARQERASNELEDTGEQTEDEKANAIKRSQETHELNIAKIHFMTAEDCFELSMDFYNNKDYNHSLTWSMETLRKYKEETTEEHSFTEVDVLEYIAYTHYLMGDLKSAVDWTKKLLNLDPNHPPALENLPLYLEAIAEQEAANKSKGEPKNEEANFIMLSEKKVNLHIAKSDLMPAAACFKLCKDFYFENDFKNSVAWGMEALRKYKAETNKNHSFTEVDVLDYISSSHFMMGDEKTALEWIQKLLKLDPNHQRLRNFLRAAGHEPLFEKAIAEQEANKKQVGSGLPTGDEKDENEKAKPNMLSKVASLGSSWSELKLRYEALCRGEMEINSDVAKRLFCRYMSENHPFLRLAPIKAEQVYIDPDVFVFHGVLSDDEIQVIQVMSIPRLKRAMVNNATTIDVKSEVTCNCRISKVAFLRDQESPVVARVSQRVADMTGLSMESAEQLQVVNYGIGGQYEPHFDIPGNNTHPFKPEIGNRIATALFYMSDVAQGGATVFTELGLSVIPERGAALYWRNLHPSGDDDLATRHAGCPVLLGSKWVCNKWIHEGGQELTKPCSWDCQREEAVRKIRRTVGAYYRGRV